MFTAVHAALQPVVLKLNLAKEPQEMLVIDSVRHTREDRRYRNAGHRS